jgi:phage protein D
MKPTFKILAGGNDITSDVTDRLVSFTITDSVDEKSDSFDMTLGDPEQTLALPRSGTKIEVFLGYNDDKLKMGSYIVDEVSIESPPDLINISGSATPFVSDRASGGASSSIMGRKSRAWEGKTIGEIVKTIASECSLSSVIDPAIANIQVPYIGQMRESDSNLMLRLARKYGAVLKTIDGRIVLTSEGGGLTASGKPFTNTIFPTQVKSWRMSIGGKNQGIKKVRTRVRDYKTGEDNLIEQEVDGFQFQEVTPSKNANTGSYANIQNPTQQQTDEYYEPLLQGSSESGEAEQSTKATAKRIERSKKSLDMTMAGRNDLNAGMIVELLEFRDGVTGKWKIVTVRHDVSRSGWLTNIVCEGP